MTWQPIATAPRDGTLVLACTAGFKADDGGFSAGIAPCAVYFGTYHPNAAGKAEWRNARTRAREPHITHWMPLPEAP